MQRVLIVGAGGVGEALRQNFGREYDVHTAGIAGEMFKLDIANPAEVAVFFRHSEHSGELYDHVVVASGVNNPAHITSLALHRSMVSQMEVNYLGPMMVLSKWLRSWVDGKKNGEHVEAHPHHFVVVGSNSAHIPRSDSAGYCASKAALEMGIRVAAREAARRWATVSVWGVNPGWIVDTRMSRQVERKLGDKPAHRIPGNRVLRADQVARFILEQVVYDRRYLNGTMVRMDGGEI